LMEETRVHGENHKPVANFITLCCMSTTCHECGFTHNFSADRLYLFIDYFFVRKVIVENVMLYKTHVHCFVFFVLAWQHVRRVKRELSHLCLYS
jgi:hypothetical protein